MYATLIVVRGTADKRQLQVKLPAVLGRSRHADLTIAHALISRTHCELSVRDGAVVLRDLGSLNGTFCGDRRIQQVPLMPNDQFTVGPLTFEIRYEPARTGALATGRSGAAAAIELSDPILQVPLELEDPIKASEPAPQQSTSEDHATFRIDLPLPPGDRGSAPLDVPTRHGQPRQGQSEQRKG